MAGRGNRFSCSSGVLLFRYCLTVNDKRDRGRADFGDPESVPDTGGAEGAAEQPSQRHDEEDIAAQRDDQRRHSLAQTFQRTGRGGGHRRHDEAEADDTERRCTDVDCLRVRAEQADQGAGDGEADSGWQECRWRKACCPVRRWGGDACGTAGPEGRRWNSRRGRCRR